MISTVVLFVTFIIMMMLTVPIAFSMVLAVAAALIFDGNLTSLSIIAQKMGNAPDSFTLLCVPLFLLAGNLMVHIGMAQRLAIFSMALVGHIRGGLAHSVVVANVIMAGMSGSATADAAATGSIFIPMLKKANYGAAYSAAVTATASVIGPIIPPSIIIVIYAGLANVSVGRLLLAGIVPGLLMGLALMATIYIRALRRGYPVERRRSLKELLYSAKDAVLALLMPVVILAGLLGGIYTATEGAAMAVVYALFVGLVIYRTLNWQLFILSMKETVIANGVVMLIVCAATPFAWVLTAQGGADFIRNLLAQNVNESWIVWSFSIALILILGCFMESVSILFITVPILLPALNALHADPVQVGIAFVLAAMIGAVTPPVGVSMFFACRIAEVTIMEFTKEFYGLLIGLFVVLALVIVFPQITTAIPNLIFKP